MLGHLMLFLSLIKSHNLETFIKHLILKMAYEKFFYVQQPSSSQTGRFFRSKIVNKKIICTFKRLVEIFITLKL
ncbi:hypothetical protein BpHYR1_006865 [Brachionus plicatilis]|uniref:Uncharacterized protein n=1 Tax=Brachionus plicatilis TaxID=10195 RepID=A0A3M7P9A4_BRAPC|nr:hypothetical protein BpHYR1_006865 [Brachionus plicatilis]